MHQSRSPFAEFFLFVTFFDCLILFVNTFSFQYSIIITHCCLSFFLISLTSFSPFCFSIPLEYYQGRFPICVYKKINSNVLAFPCSFSPDGKDANGVYIVDSEGKTKEPEPPYDPYCERIVDHPTT